MSSFYSGFKCRKSAESTSQQPYFKYTVSGGAFLTCVPSLWWYSLLVRVWKGKERCNCPSFSWVWETHSSGLEPFLVFSSPTLLCYPQLPGCKRQTGKHKTAGSSLLYTGWKKFWRRVCDNSFQDSFSGYLGVSMLDPTPDSALRKRTGSTSNCVLGFLFTSVVQKLTS